MASCGDNADPKSKSNSKTLTQEQIIAGFQELRNQQRLTISKIAEVDIDKKEHELVIEALKKMESSRKCFRLAGGVLIERTVEEVLPNVTSNYEQIIKVGEVLQKQLETKGKELQEYREKHNIKIRGENEKPFDMQEKKTTDKVTGTSVLVS